VRTAWMAKHRADEPAETVGQVRQHQGWGALLLAVLGAAGFVVLVLLCCAGFAMKGWM
jgi:hypothetical protein